MNNLFRITELLNAFTAGYQRAELLANLRQGPDNLYVHVLARLADRWDQTPTTAQMHGATRSAIARWHFTKGASDYWIIAKDTGASQSHAYGLASISYVHAAPEPGHISIPDILADGAQLDLYFEPVTVAEITQACVG